jgi:hypothetical protein
MIFLSAGVEGHDWVRTVLLKGLVLISCNRLGPIGVHLLLREQVVIKDKDWTFFGVLFLSYHLTFEWSTIVMFWI